METINSSEAVKEQYGTADNLSTRISIHEKYSVNKQGFDNWLFSHYDLCSSMRVLELGCGTGKMWKSKLHLLDKETRLYLTDFSENMVSSARASLGEDARVEYNVVNIENIPYKDNSFDAVIANMMLYHVPNLDKGLSEVKRVLTDEGLFYCATYGENGIMPFIAGLLKDYGVKDTTNKNFTLQNGCEILGEYFSDIKRFDYKDSLTVTNIDDLLDYIYSLTSMSSVAEIKREILSDVLQKNTVNGVINIPKEYGMFMCKK